jgi:hypothetical protein
VNATETVLLNKYGRLRKRHLNETDRKRAFRSP